MEMNGENIHPYVLVSDGHGTAFEKRFFPNLVHRSTEGPSRDQSRIIQELVDLGEPENFTHFIQPLILPPGRQALLDNEVSIHKQPFDDLPLVNKTRQVMFSVHNRLAWLEDWIVSNIPTETNSEFFLPYKGKEGAKQGYKTIYEEIGGRITFCSGTPTKYSERFIRKLNSVGFLQYVNRDYPAVLTPDLSRNRDWPGRDINSIGTKLLTLEFLRSLYGSCPDLAEDQIEMCEWAAFFCGARVFNPLSRDEAEKNRVFELPDYAYQNGYKGKIYFNTPIGKIPERLQQIKMNES